MHDEPAMLDFYRRLGVPLLFQDWEGLTLQTEEEWRAAGCRIFSIQLEDIKIWMIPFEVWRARGWTTETLRAPEARAGTADLCFVWDGSVEDALQHLAATGADVIAGPMEREGGADGGRRLGQSIYFRDPDMNLLELIVYR